eukprot:734511_1
MYRTIYNYMVLIWIASGQEIVWRYHSEPLSYEDARLSCQQTDGLHLATITTEEDLENAKNAIGVNDAPYIGIYSEKSREQKSVAWFIFDSGVPCPDMSSGACVNFWRYTKDQSHQPRCIEEDIHNNYCTVYYPNDKMIDNDIDCNTAKPFLCSGIIASPPNIGSYTGNYIVHNGPYSLTWEQAQAFCQQKHGTDLATFYTADDVLEVEQLIGSVNQAGGWIGLNDRQVEGTFKWVGDAQCVLPDIDTTCSPFWRAGEPNNMGDIQGNDAGCVIIWPFRGVNPQGFHWEVDCSHEIYLQICNAPQGEQSYVTSASAKSNLLNSMDEVDIVGNTK